LSSSPRPTDARAVGLELDELLDQQFDSTRSDQRFKASGSRPASSGAGKKPSFDSRRPNTARASSDDDNEEDSRTFYDVNFHDILLIVCFVYRFLHTVSLSSCSALKLNLSRAATIANHINSTEEGQEEVFLVGENMSKHPHRRHRHHRPLARKKIYTRSLASNRLQLKKKLKPLIESLH